MSRLARAIMTLDSLEEMPPRVACDTVFRGLRTGTMPLFIGAAFATRRVRPGNLDEKEVRAWVNVVAHISGHEDADDDLIRVSAQFSKLRPQILVNGNFRI